MCHLGAYKTLNTPTKINCCNLKMMGFQFPISSSRGPFSGSMLIFGGWNVFGSNKDHHLPTWIHQSRFSKFFCSSSNKYPFPLGFPSLHISVPSTKMPSGCEVSLEARQPNRLRQFCAPCLIGGSQTCAPRPQNMFSVFIVFTGARSFKSTFSRKTRMAIQKMRRRTKKQLVD